MPKQRGVSTTALLTRLDPEDRLPLHRQLYADIRNAIVSGRIPAGARIPSSRGLAEDLGVSRTTVLQAVDQLRAEGYLRTVVGSGTRVVDVLPEKLTSVRLAAPAPAPAPEGRTSACGLSARGREVVAVPRSVFRAAGDIPPFRLGIPGLDLFPRKVWNRLLIHRARMTSVTELDYGSPPGVPPLREAIARYVAAARGVRCTPEQVIVIGGVQHGMGFLARLLLDPGEKAWLEEPAYLAARAALSAASAHIVPVPVDREGIDVEEGMRRAPDARLVFVSPSHQYPLGVTMSLRRRLMLIDWARQANAWILEDDYDSEFRYGGRPLMALQGLDGGSRVIYLGTFSKSVFPALRIGFLVVPPELVEGFARARLLMEQHPPILQQLVLADFIREGHFARHVRRMRRAYEARQDAMVTAVHRELGGTLALDPADAGLHMAGYLPPELPDREVTQAALARGVEVSPLSVHYLDAAAARNGLLLGFASTGEAAIRDGVRRLAQAIDAVAQARAGRWTSAA